jgi:hypothetical protein
MLPDTRPGDRPTTLPARPGPDRPGMGVNRPTPLPAPLPGRPGIGDRPGLGQRPGGGGPVTLPGQIPGGNRPTIPDPPGRPPRPPRPDWGDRWQGRDNQFVNVQNTWNVNVTRSVNTFIDNRDTRWNAINRWGSPGWARGWGTTDFVVWRRGVWDFRRDRCHELWYRTGPLGFHNSFFNVHWWGTSWWRPRPLPALARSPWWWWRPLRWTSVSVFWGPAIAPQPVIYDPGTTVFYEGDTVYIDGQPSGQATAARADAVALANPVLEETPVPDPPATGADNEDGTGSPEGDWLPVGVWALTQQQQGDATMFFQLSIDRNGIVAGAYKNVLTGDEQPVAGRLDFKTQRVAWHIGSATTTVYETSLSNLENDVAGLFVHFGEAQTQTWMLVRMPSPEMPPATARIPDIGPVAASAPR